MPGRIVLSPSWAGRKHHLSELAPARKRTNHYARCSQAGSVIYKTSFSSLFQEWLETDEAKAVTKGFENTFLLPYPLRPAEIEITLLDPRRNVRASMKHTVSPDDILIHQKGTAHITPHKYLLQSGNTAKCIDVAILAEGYTRRDAVFYEDAILPAKVCLPTNPSGP